MITPWAEDCNGSKKESPEGPSLNTNLNVLDAVNAILVNELKTSGNSKTFDKSGILFIQTGTTAQTYLYLNSALIGSGFYSTVIPNHAGGTDCRQLLISKGDTLTSGGSGGTTGTMSLKFVPYK